MGKTRKVRKAPIESATSLPEGTIKGNWVIKKVAGGSQRWMPTTSAELNGFRLFTTDYAAKHSGKPIILYTREYKEVWPSKTAWSKPADSTYTKLTFVPNGDAIKGKTRLDGWLKTKSPAIKKGDRFAIDGPLYENGKYFADSVQVDSSDGKRLSTNLMNTEVFVKV
jgi:hypothetical protein